MINMHFLLKMICEGCIRIRDIVLWFGMHILVWYAYRNALRVVYILGKYSLKDMWSEKTVYYAYATLRSIFLLSRWLVYKNNIYIKASVAASASKVFYAAYVSADRFNEVEYVNFARAIRSISRATRSTVKDINATESMFVGMGSILEPIRGEILSDFNCSLSHRELNWLGLPLWSVNPPLDYQLWGKSLIKQLIDLKLDFLAKDLLCLWESKSLLDHAPNYLLDLSESITNDPQALRRAILFGETTEQVKAVRVLLLGSGGAGKTSLANRLKGNHHSIQTSATIGVDYQQHQALKLHETQPELKLESTDLDLYLWDFGGQTIFHGLHRAFLHENCVYALVVDNRHEQAPEEWLHQIRHLAGTQAKVLLVTNEYENCHSRQNETRLIREFEGLLDKDSFFYFPCKKPADESTDQAHSFEYFVKALIKASEDSRKSVFASTLAVQKQLTKEYENEVFLHENYVLDLIEKETKETDSALNQLKQLGFLISLKSESLQYCLKPAWAVDNTYQVLYAESIRINNGLASMRDINKVLTGQVKLEHTEYLTDFLKERSLCCFLPNKQFFFPDAAAANEPELVRELLNDLTNVTLNFDLPYLPLGFHTRLVHQLFNDQATSIKDIKHVWRQGFILSTRDAQAVVQYHLRKASIEVVLVGKVEQFAQLFQTFYSALKQAVISEKGLKENQISLAILFNEKPFAVHSSTDFLAALKGVHNFKDVAEAMDKLNKNIHINAANNNQIIIGNNSSQKQDSDNHTKH